MPYNLSSPQTGYWYTYVNFIHMGGERHCRVNPLLPNISMHILHTVLYTLLREDMLNNQELLKLVIISYILLTFMFHSGVILFGEFRH